MDIEDANQLDTIEGHVEAEGYRATGLKTWQQLWPSRRYKTIQKVVLGRTNLWTTVYAKHSR